MIRVGVHIPGRHDATNWYRASGPLSHLRKTFDRELMFEHIGEWSFTSVLGLDVAFFQRPSTALELEAIRICRRLGVPVILDYDDLLFDVPADNPAHANYANRKTQEAIIGCIREASCVWVSTKELKRCLQIPGASLNERIYVVPNALDERHLVSGRRAEPPALINRLRAVMWRGSPTHERDIMEYAAEILEVSQEARGRSFVFAGYNPWFLTERMAGSQAVLSGALPVGEFMDFLYATAADVGMVPLHDSRFNRCKSNIAWLEMTWAGAAVLAPDWEEWQRPGVTNYRTPEDYARGLRLLTQADAQERAKLNEQSWSYITENLLLKHVNKLRQDTIYASVFGGTWPDGWQPLPEPDAPAMELE